MHKLIVCISQRLVNSLHPQPKQHVVNEWWKEVTKTMETVRDNPLMDMSPVGSRSKWSIDIIGYYRKHCKTELLFFAYTSHPEHAPAAVAVHFVDIWRQPEALYSWIWWVHRWKGESSNGSAVANIFIDVLVYHHSRYQHSEWYIENTELWVKPKLSCSWELW